MKYTLLEIVQDILNDLDSDEVNSIDDTIESQQVAQIVKTTYNKMMSNRNWPHQRTLVQLTSSGTSLRPNYLRAPTGLKELIYFEYDRQTASDTRVAYREIKYKEPDDFLRFVSQRDSSKDNITTVADPSGVSLLVINDAAPTYWTSFDDDWIVTDSYDSEVDTTLKTAKTRCLAFMESTWTHTDTAVPDMPEEAFAALIEEAKSVAFFTLKQMVNQKAEQEAQRQQRWLSRKAWRNAGGIKFNDYGRRSKK